METSVFTATQSMPARPEMRKRVPWPPWFPLLVLSIGLGLVTRSLPPWAFMWAMAFIIYAGCKWLTFQKALSTGTVTDGVRAWAYLFAWPGMDAVTFLACQSQNRIKRWDWYSAIFKTTLGAWIFWGVARMSYPESPLLTGWVGMVGLILLLHFGSFHLLSLFWRTLGFSAEPLMKGPLLSTSLSEFWGSRWNTAFRDLAHHHLFLPFFRFGVTTATLGVFLASGLVHELVISLPAGAGFGLPTLYFLLQGAGILAERSKAGRKLKLARGWTGWLFTFVVTAGPAAILFHPPFVRSVILPFMKVSGAF